jgi:hypothetical protein
MEQQLYGMAAKVKRSGLEMPILTSLLFAFV